MYVVYNHVSFHRSFIGPSQIYETCDTNTVLASNTEINLYYLYIYCVTVVVSNTKKKKKKLNACVLF